MRKNVEIRLYTAWTNMRARCRNKNTKWYKYYGGRGITICKRWGDFPSFAADMGPHPGKGWTLDRKRNGGNYRKSNCRWATWDTQQQNRDCCTLSWEIVVQIRALHGRQKRNVDIAKEYGIPQFIVSKVVCNRIWKVSP